MTTTRKLSPRQRKRMAAIVVEFQKYVATYSDQQCYQDYSDRTFIEDMLYGIGVAIDRERFRAADGFAAWKQELQQYVSPPVQPSAVLHDNKANVSVRCPDCDDGAYKGTDRICLTCNGLGELRRATFPTDGAT